MGTTRALLSVLAMATLAPGIRELYIDYKAPRIEFTSGYAKCRMAGGLWIDQWQECLPNGFKPR